MPGGVRPPPSVIESWPKPSLHPEKVGWSTSITLSILYAVTVLVVSARLWTRTVIQRRTGIDDVLIVVAMVPILGLVICFSGATHSWGFDRHVWDLNVNLLIASRKVILAVIAFYVSSTMLIRVSILLFYRQLSNSAISPRFTRIIHVAIGFMILTTIGLIIVPFVGCRPLNSYWNLVDPEWRKTHISGVDYSCINEPAYLISASSLSILMDFVTWLMPMPLLWMSNLPLRQRISMILLFALGLFTCLCTVIRICFLFKVFYWTYDVSWTTGNSFIWLGLEVHLGVICASTPALKIVWRRWRHNRKQIHQVPLADGSFPRTSTLDTEKTEKADTERQLFHG